MPNIAPAARAIGRATAFVAVVAALAPAAAAQTTSLASLAADGTLSDSNSSVPDLSADGRYVVFTSASTKLVPGTVSTKVKVFLADRLTGAVENLSVSSKGVEASQDAARPRISPDGRFVVFDSSAGNLVAGDGNAKIDCFLRDREAGTTTLISRASDGSSGNGDSTRAVVSADGRFILFASFADNFAKFDNNGTQDIFLHDREEETTDLVSAALDGTVASGYSETLDFSDDGRFALFQSSSNDIVAGSTANWVKILLRDLQAGVTEQVSITWDGFFVASDCRDGRMSGDGRFVTFTCSSQTVVQGDSNQRDDIFLRDRQLATTERVNLGPDEEQDDGGAQSGRVSDDGRYVAFSSVSTVFAPTDTNDAMDVYLRDRWRGETRHLSLSTDGGASNLGCDYSLVCGDGHVVAFTCAGDALDSRDHNNKTDVFVHERAPNAARSQHYGVGFPGKLGVPTAELAGEPVIGAPIDLVVSNSSTLWTLGFVLVGATSADLPASWGGDLLVAPLFALPIPLPPSGYVLHDEIEYDAEFWNLVFYVQVLELDPFAAEGVSNTDGIEIALGH